MNAMTTAKKLLPEGEPIEAARKRIGLSQNAAAREVGISGTRWRQIVKGTGSSDGSRISVRGGEGTVARMAMLVGVTAEDMDLAGRPDVARKMTDSDPLTASAVWWDEEIVGPNACLYEGETLRWRDETNTRGEPMRTFQMELDSVQHEASLDPDTPPGEAAPRLRASLADRVMMMTQLLMGRTQHRQD